MQYNLQLEILLYDFCKMIRDKRTSNESLKLHLRKVLRQRKECIETMENNIKQAEKDILTENDWMKK